MKCRLLGPLMEQMGNYSSVIDTEPVKLWRFELKIQEDYQLNYCWQYFWDTLVLSQVCFWKRPFQKVAAVAVFRFTRLFWCFIQFIVSCNMLPYITFMIFCCETNRSLRSFLLSLQGSHLWTQWIQLFLHKLK